MLWCKILIVSDLSIQGEVRHIAFRNILAVNNNPPKEFPLINLTNCRSTCSARGPRTPQFKFNNLFNEHFPSCFFKSILCVKTGEVEKWYNYWKYYWKVVQLMVSLTKHAIHGPDLHCSVPLALRRFLQHLPAKYKWRPKNVLLSERGALALCHMANPALVISVRS